jgi:Tfp pilus assembly protein PilF
MSLAAPAPSREEVPEVDVSSAADRFAEQATQALVRGDYPACQLLINKALKLRIDKSYYHLINALSYHLVAKNGDQGAFDLAEQGYDQAIHFDPSNWMAYYYRGRLHLETGKYQQAVADLSEAMMFRPGDTEVLNAMAYAAYRIGRPDIAAGVLARIEKQGGDSPNTLRNMAMTMAAVGDGDAAQRYLALFRQGGGNLRDARRLEGRISDWNQFYAGAKVELAQFTDTTGQNAAGGFGSPGAGPGIPPPGTGLVASYANNGAVRPGALTAADATTAKGTEDRMVVIDVIMISTEETIATNKGVNLLNGLSLQFGGTVNGITSPAYGILQQATTNSASTTTITRAITLPSVSYTLNILNANNQRSEVLSRPTLIGLAGKESEFFSGDELNAAAVAGSGSGNTILGGQAINIQKEIGVSLKVLPVVMEDGRLKLAVNVERTFIETPSEDVNFTFKLETSKDTISANVIMRYGESLILGGLSEKETQLNRDGVPGLQDVPLVQYLFSNESRSDYQKSLLILLTPRTPQYVYQPEAAREAYEKSLSDEERPIANLSARYADWFKPYPNWASVFHHLQDNGLYREFRTGDVDLESWSSMQHLSDRLNQALDFLRY